MDFEHLLQRWQAGDRIASAAEHAVDAELDAWCDGRGRPPTPDLIAGVRALRAAALRDWERLCRCVGQEQRALPTL